MTHGGSIIGTVLKKPLTEKFCEEVFMIKNMTRRRFLECCAAATALSAVGSIGCMPARPTHPALAWKTAAGELLALRNAVIVEVEKGGLVSGKVLLVRDGLIERIVDAEDPNLEQARSIDCQGGYLIPGLIDAHCHITMPALNNISTGDFGEARKQVFRNYEDAITWGVTTVRDMAALPKYLQKDREAIAAKKRIGPHILTPMGFITVPGGYPEFFARIKGFSQAIVGPPALYADTPQMARDHVNRYHDMGADWVKIAFDHYSNLYGHGQINTLTDAQVDAILDEAAKKGLPVAAHHMYVLGLERGLQFGVDSMEHLPSDADVPEKLLAKAVEARMPFVPTATAGMNLAYKSQGDPYNDDPYLEQVLTWRKQEVMPEIASHCTERIYELVREHYEFFINERHRLPENANKLSTNPAIFTRAVVIGSRNLERLIQAGAVIGVGNDSGVPLTFPGMLHYEMLMLTRAGMTSAQALRAATAVNAAICKIDDRCGTLEPGKRADLVLLAGDPLADIRNVARVRAVFKEGELMSKSDDFVIDTGAA